MSGRTCSRRRALRTATVASAAAVLLAAGCRRLGRVNEPVDVVYAASLTAAMEQGIGPAFEQVRGRGYRGVARGSTAGAHQIRDGVLTADVYLTADPGTLSGLGTQDPGWGVAFATGELALGYRRGGRFAPALDSASRGLVRWWRVLERPGFRFGRTDPALDPKGYRTLWLFRLAGRYYGVPELADSLAGGERQVFPEDQLGARVETGQLDAGVFYLSEAKAQGLAVVRLPPAVNLGDPACDSLYRTVVYRGPDSTLYRGGPILYAGTVPKNAPDPAAGRAFLAFLLSDRGRRELRSRGYEPTGRVLGDSTRMPSDLRRVVEDSAAGRGPGPSRSCESSSAGLRSRAVGSTGNGASSAVGPGSVGHAE